MPPESVFAVVAILFFPVDAQYVRGLNGAGPLGCPFGMWQAPEEECEAAAIALSLSWFGSIAATGSLGGCIADSSRAYFNMNGATENSRSDIAPLCGPLPTTTASTRSTKSTSSATFTSTSRTSTSESTSTRTSTKSLTSFTVTATTTTSLTAAWVVPESKLSSDFWFLSADGLTLLRMHVTARRNLFVPSDVSDSPVPLEKLLAQRSTFVSYLVGGSMTITDRWNDSTLQEWQTDFAWTGKTTFYLAQGSDNSTSGWQADTAFTSSVFRDIISYSQMLSIFLSLM